MTNNTEIRKSLPLEEVEYNEGTATLTFLDEEQGEILQVNLHSKKFDKEAKKKVEDAEYAERAEKNAQEYFGVAFDDLNKAVGQEHDIYVYDRFCSLWEVEQIEKFSVDKEGEIFQTTIEEVREDNIGIHILFKYEGNLHQSRMRYADFNTKKRKYYKNPNLQNKQYSKFADKFGVDIKNADEIVGKEIMVEIKESFGKAYADIKKPKWSK